MDTELRLAMYGVMLMYNIYIFSHLAQILVIAGPGNVCLSCLNTLQIQTYCISLSPMWAVYCEEHHARDNENNLCFLYLGYL